MERGVYGRRQHARVRGTRVRGVLAALSGAIWALAALPGPASAERIFAELDRPYESEHVQEPVGLIEVRGWAGTGIRGSHDVVLVIDRSASTWLPSGVDVDGDGRVGEQLGFNRGLPVLSDPDDSIAGAQLAAARRLIERLDSGSTRMGIVVFARNERVMARMGTSREELLAVLDGLGARPERGGTYFYGAIMASVNVLKQAPTEQGEVRQRSIILLSDGLPNQPAPVSFAEKAAVRASRHAARARARIFSFALGDEVAARPRVFVQMADANGGDLLIVERPGEVIEYVPHLSLTKLRSVQVDNLSTGKSGRAIRLFPDGSFDGFVPVVPGENRLRVTIEAEAGSTKSIDRTIHFEKVDDPARLQQLLRQLEIRTVETAFAEEAQRKRDVIKRRQLEIETDDDPDAGVLVPLQEPVQLR
jgi:hypothetical protein